MIHDVYLVAEDMYTRRFDLVHVCLNVEDLKSLAP